MKPNGFQPEIPVISGYQMKRAKELGIDISNLDGQEAEVSITAAAQKRFFEGEGKRLLQEPDPPPNPGDRGVRYNEEVILVKIDRSRRDRKIYMVRHLDNRRPIWILPGSFVPK